MKVKAISLWEPWASLMRSRAKTIETRSWPTSYRGPLLICASQKWDRSLCDLLRRRDFQEVLKTLPEHTGKDLVQPKDLLFGQAVCLVDLVDCVPTESASLMARLSRLNRDFGNFDYGRFAWCTRNLRTFAPFPVRGRQGLFEVELPPDIRWIP